MKANLEQLRRETGAVVRAIGRGERVIVTDRGRPVAEMSAAGKAAKTGNNELFGAWRDNKTVASVQGYIDKMRKGRHATGFRP